MIKHSFIALALTAFAMPTLAADKAPPREGAVGAFTALQELPPLTPEEMAARRKPDDDAAIAGAETALNEWKTCVQGALTRWAAIQPGPGLVVDGAIGLCSEIERNYRIQLMRIVENGRLVIDMQMARTLLRNLEEAWRPRLLAAALDLELARRQAAVAPVAAAASAAK